MEAHSTDTMTTYPSLRAWREAHGYSQREAAEYLGLTQPRYSHLERGLACNKFHAFYLSQKTGVPTEVLAGADR